MAYNKNKNWQAVAEQWNKELEAQYGSKGRAYVPFTAQSAYHTTMKLKSQNKDDPKFSVKRAALKTRVVYKEDAKSFNAQKRLLSDLGFETKSMSRKEVRGMINAASPEEMFELIQQAVINKAYADKGELPPDVLFTDEEAIEDYAAELGISAHELWVAFGAQYNALKA